MEVGGFMKTLTLIIAYMLLVPLALADRTDRTTGTTERMRDGGDVVLVLPLNATRVSKGEAFERIYKTTETLTTRSVVRYSDDGTTRIKVIERVTVNLIKPRTYTLRLRDDYFFWPDNGKYYRYLNRTEAGYTTPTALGVPVR